METSEASPPQRTAEEPISTSACPKECEFKSPDKTKLSSPVVTCLGNVRPNSLVVDWHGLKRKLKDDAAQQGWSMASKVQNRAGGKIPGWSGPIYCTRTGCSWGCMLHKDRDTGRTYVSQDECCLEHNHALKPSIFLPAMRGVQTILRSTEAEMTCEEKGFCRTQARYIKKPAGLARCLRGWARENGLGQVNYSTDLCRTIM